MPPQASVFEQPGVAKELWTVHVLTAGDLDARYLGSRATLEPLFASYGMPANSDYAPVLDRNAARHRFTEKSATDVVALLNAEIPLLEMLEPGRSKRAINPLFQGAYAFERVENTRLAWYARDFLLRSRSPEPDAVPRELQKDLELVKLRLLECREPRELDVWLHSAIRVAKALNPYLAPDDVGAVWGRIVGSACYPYLQDYQRRWLALFQAVGARNAPRMAEISASLLAEQQHAGRRCARISAARALTGYVASGAKPKALELWGSYSPSVRVTRPGVSPAALPRRSGRVRQGLPRLRRALRPRREAHRAQDLAHERLAVFQVPLQHERREPVDQRPGGSARSGRLRAQMGEGIREPRLQVGVGPRTREHQAKALRVLERETDVSLAELAARSTFERGVELLEALRHQRGQQRFAIGEVAVRGVVGNPGAARRLSHAQAARPSFSTIFHAAASTAAAQVPVVVCCHWLHSPSGLMLSLSTIWATI